MRWFAALCISATGATAQQGCDTRDRIVDRLLTRYGEAPAGVGLSQGKLLEIFTSTETGTFTVVMTDARRYSCIVAAGTVFWFVTEPPGEDG